MHTTNMGDDTPLHLGAAHGHREVVHTVSAEVTRHREMMTQPFFSFSGIRQM